MPEEKITLLIADDQAIIRQGLRRILEAEPDMSVVGEAATGGDAVKRARQLKPDVVIMDVFMPDHDGVESLRQIAKAQSCRVLVLSLQLEHHFISEAVSAGAAGYMSKGCLEHELVAAIRSVVHGGTVFSAAVSRVLAESSRNGGTGTASRSLEALTARERQIFLLLAEGGSPGRIAASLFVSPKTVHTHRQHIMDKLGLRTTTELIRFALRQRLIKVV